VVLGAGALGANADAGATRVETYTSSVAWDVSTAALPSAGHLDLGLVDDTAAGRGFNLLTLQVTEQGDAVLDKSFTSLSAAEAFFTNGLRDLGAVAAGGTGTFDVQVTLTERIAGAGNGFGVDLMLGVDPSAALDASGITAVPGDVASGGMDFLAPPIAPGDGQFGASLATCATGMASHLHHVAAGPDDVPTLPGAMEDGLVWSSPAPCGGPLLPAGLVGHDLMTAFQTPSGASAAGI
jgi:hypothetical protein